MLKEAIRNPFVATYATGQRNQLNADLLMGRFEVEKPKIDVENATNVANSLATFSNQLNEGGLLELITSYRKTDYPCVDASQFSLRPTEKEYPAGREKDEAGSYFRDGEAGLLLRSRSTTHPEIQLILAIVSFSFPKHTNNNPLIEQLQSSKYYDGYEKENTEEYREEAQATLKSFRWERVLIDLVSLWAGNECFPRVYVQKGADNYWVHHGYSLPPDRAKQRYDGTARNAGFKQVNGMWMRPPSMIK